MLWLLFALLTAFCVASQDAWVKNHFSHFNVYEMAAYPMVYSLPLLVACLLFISFPLLDSVFGWCFLISLPLNGVCFLLYIRAIQISPLSLTLPYLAFTPVFMLLTGFILLNELPNLWGAMGVLLTVIGSYVLNLESDRSGFFAPILAIRREPGSLIMLLVAFLFSFAAVIGKMGIVHSSPIFFALAFFSAHNLIVPLFLWLLGKIRPSELLKLPGKGMIAGLLFFGHVVFHCLAIVLTKAVYMIAVKRFSILIGVLYGRIWFREDFVIKRLLGASIMVAGSAMIMIMGS
jgi:drug/metabolite transporter (DMT)-like permease